MTVTETIKHAVGMDAEPETGARECLTYFLWNKRASPTLQLGPPRVSILPTIRLTTLIPLTAASREAMSEARLPLAYRDSCAHLLIPLNRCRFQEFYLPWKCEVSTKGASIIQPKLKEREYRTRDMPMRNVNSRSSQRE